MSDQEAARRMTLAAITDTQRAAEQLVTRHSEVFTGDIPQRNIDGAQCTHDCGAAEMAP